MPRASTAGEIYTSLGRLYSDSFQRGFLFRGGSASVTRGTPVSSMPLKIKSENWEEEMGENSLKGTPPPSLIDVPRVASSFVLVW